MVMVWKNFFFLTAICNILFQFVETQECSTAAVNTGVTFSDYKNVGYLTFSQCCDECRNELALYLSFGADKTLTVKRTCYCHFSGDIVQKSGWSMLTFSRKMFNSANSNITSGEKTTIRVIDPFTKANTNDKSEFYAVENISSLNVPFKSFDIQKFTPVLIGVEPKSDPVNFRNNSFIFDYNKQASNTKPYELEIQFFGLDGKRSVDWLWFTMVRTNDEFIVFHSEKIEVVEPSKGYDIRPSKFEIWNQLNENDTSFFVIFQNIPGSSTISDSRNFFINLIMEETVEIQRVVPSEWNGEKCVWFNKMYKRSNSITTFEYEILFAKKPVCFVVTVIINEETKILRGLKPLRILAEFKMVKIVKSALKPDIRINNAYTAIVDEKNSQKAFSLYYKSFEICLMPQSGERRTRLKLDDILKATKVNEYCTRLLKIGKNLKTDIHDDCLQIGNQATQVYDQCSTQYTIIDYKDDETLLVNNERPVQISGTHMISSNPGVTPTKFQRVNRKSFGLTKETTRSIYKTDIITAVKCGEEICTCVLSKNRTNSKCIAINSITKSTKILPNRIAEIIAHNNETNLTYGEDIDRNILQIQKDNRSIIMKFVSNTRWNSIKLKHVEFINFAVKAERKDLVDTPVRISDQYNLTYFGIFNENEIIAILVKDENCKGNVGTSKETALKSCNAHKLYCPEAESRLYYVTKAYNDPAYGQVYCDMETDGGGWMMIFKYEAKNMKPLKSQFQSLHNTEDIFEVVNSNYTKLINSYGGLTNIEANCGEIVQVRWYCTKSDHGRTIHVATNRNLQGSQYIQYLQGERRFSPLCCPVMYIFKDDTSEIFQQCNKIGDRGYCSDYPFGASRISFEPFYTKDHFHQPHSHYCDDENPNSNHITKHGIWKIFVRNAV